jgi:triacylglycerol esterase/lipase EstA (alpha/beta hydrolase family)
MTLFETAESTLEYLASYNIGARPLAFIAHSLGGLLVKQMLRTAKETAEAGWNAIGAGTRLVVFIATPHTGAIVTDLASLNSSWRGKSAARRSLTVDDNKVSALALLAAPCRSKALCRSASVEIFF